MPIRHNLTATTPDDPSYEIRPSHWNSDHAVSLVGSEVIGAFSNAGNVSFGLGTNGAITGSANVTAAPSPVNVTGANGSSVNAQTIAFSNSNGLTLGVSTAANGATVTGSYTVPGATVFSNSNNVSFGLNGSTVTATASFNGLTTAAQSNQVVNGVNGSTGQISFNAGSSLSASTNGSSVTFGLASNITTALQSAGAYLTTAAQSNHSHGNPTLNLTNISGTTGSNSAGFTLSLSAAPAGLTTARASNDAIGLNSAFSNVTATVNSSGFSMDARGYAGTATAVTGAASVTLNSGGLSFNGANLAGTTSGFTGANVSASITHNTAGLAMSLSVAAGAGQFSAGVSNVGNTGGQTGISGTRLVFVGSQNITLNQATDANGATISISGGAGAAGNTGFISAGGQTGSLGTVVFSNSNGVSFGVNGQTVTASHNGLTSQSNQAASGSNGSFTFQTLSFSNANGMSFGTSAGSAITASYTVPTVPTAYVSSVNGSSGAISLNVGSSLSSSTNGSSITFGLASNITTALQSAGAYLTTAAASNHSHGNPTLNLTNLSGTTASASNGFTISLSGPPAGLTTARASNDAVGLNSAVSNVTATINSSGFSLDARGYAGTATAITGAASISLNSAGLSFNGANMAGTTSGFTGANISATITHNTAGLALSMSVAGAGGAASQTVYAVGNTTVNSSGAVPLSSVQMRGYGILSLGTSNGSILFSTPDPSTLAPAWYAVSNTTGASSSTTFAADTISIQGAGNVSVGFTNGSLVISGGGAAGGVALYDGANSISTGTARFSNSNGVSFGFNGQTITASHNGLTTAAASNHSHGNPTLALTNLTGTTASASNGLTLSLSGNAAQTVQPVAVSGANGSYAFSTLSFSNANGISFGTSAGSAITASHNALTTAAASNHSHGNPTLALTNITGTTASASNGLTLSLSGNAPQSVVPGIQSIAFANTTFTTGAVSFSNANGISFGSSGAQVTASYTVPTVTQYFSNTATTFNGANISGSFTMNTAGFQASLSVAAPGAAAEANAIAMLGANTAGNTTASGSTIGWSGLNLTLSGTNASQVVISAPATSSLVATGQVSISTNGSTISIGVPNARTQSGINPYADTEMFPSQVGNNTLNFDPNYLPNVQFDRIVMPISIVNTAGSSGSHSVSIWAGIYSRNVSTLSLIGSTSTSFAITHVGTTGIYSSISGMRGLTIASTATLTDGQYYFGVVSRTSTAGTAGAGYSQMCLSNVGTGYAGLFSAAVASSGQFTLGQGQYSVTTTGIPSSVAFSEIYGTAVGAFRAPIMMLASSTI